MLLQKTIGRRRWLPQAAPTSKSTIYHTYWVSHAHDSNSPTLMVHASSYISLQTNELSLIYLCIGISATLSASANETAAWCLKAKHWILATIKHVTGVTHDTRVAFTGGAKLRNEKRSFNRDKMGSDNSFENTWVTQSTWSTFYTTSAIIVSEYKSKKGKVKR